MDLIQEDERWMRLALEEAEAAARAGEVPIGAVVVLEGKVVGRGHNLREGMRDPTAHAEIMALRDAGTVTGSWRLDGAGLFVTVEPCPMCAGALVNARIRRLVFGCRDPKAGAVRTLYRLTEDSRLNHRIEVAEGVLEEASAALVSDFFNRLRKGRDHA